MELRHLRYFVTVAHELSFTRAAALLHIAQPPLSQQIKSLELELGCHLFERVGRSILLSSSGRELLPEAERLLASADRFRERAAQRARGEHGELTIGLVSSFATPRFAAMLRAFQKEMPGVRVELENRPSGWQLEALVRGAIDVGILRPIAPLPKNVATKVFRREPLRIAVPAQHPLAKKGVIQWSDLAGEPLIVVGPEYVSPDYYAAFFARLREAGVEPTVRQVTQNVATKVWLVSAGLGIAPMPNTPDIERHAGVVFVDGPKGSPLTETAIAWRKTDASPACARFVELARAALGS